MRALSPTQDANSRLPQTKPVSIVRHAHSGVDELASHTGGAVVYESETYSMGGIKVLGVQDGRTAQLWLPATAARINEVINGTWRDQICRIISIPAVPGDSGVYSEEDGEIEIEGKIVSSVYTGTGIEFSVLHSVLSGKYSPPDKCEAVCNFIPPPGQIISYSNGKIKLERKK